MRLNPFRVMLAVAVGLGIAFLTLAALFTASVVRGEPDTAVAMIALLLFGGVVGLVANLVVSNRARRSRTEGSKRD